METRISRRTVLAAGTAACAALAGCSGGDAAASPDDIDTDDRPAIGDESAPVTVTVFEDFACPHCRQFNAQVTPQIVQRYVEPGDVRYLHADFPIPVDETWSYAIPSAAYAVFEEAGNDAFWQFATQIYDHQGNYSLDAVETVADEVAEAGSAAREAADEGTYRERVESDKELGDSWGVSGTPTIFVEDEQVDIDEIAGAIDERL